MLMTMLFALLLILIPLLVVGMIVDRADSWPDRLADRLFGPERDSDHSGSPGGQG